MAGDPDDRQAGRDMALIIMVAIGLMLAFWLIGFDVMRDAVT